MESALRSMMNSSAKSPSSMASKPYYATKTHSFPQPPPPAQPPLLPLPAHATPLHAQWPASRPAPGAKKPRHHTAPSRQMPAPGASSAPIAVAAPSKKRVAPAMTDEVEEVGWTATDSLYSVSPPPSSVPMPTSLLATVAAARKAPTACAVEVACGAGAGVDVGATDELRRLLRL